MYNSAYLFGLLELSSRFLAREVVPIYAFPIFCPIASHTNSLNPVAKISMARFTLLKMSRAQRRCEVPLLLMSWKSPEEEMLVAESP